MASWRAFDEDILKAFIRSIGCIPPVAGADGIGRLAWWVNRAAVARSPRRRGERFF